jgi:UDP-2-acetamido-3-amino-2,3-dideoxy-glucuronate N-acetyltransferase
MKLIELKMQTDHNGSLVVFDTETMDNFKIVRVFSVYSGREIVRGNHAHKECNQLLICNSGNILVKTFDGLINQEFLLDRPNLGLLVPAGVWSQQYYLSDECILTVICDKPFEPSDYIRDYSEFKKFIRTKVVKKSGVI